MRICVEEGKDKKKVGRDCEKKYAQGVDACEYLSGDVSMDEVMALAMKYINEMTDDEAREVLDKFKEIAQWIETHPEVC